MADFMEMTKSLMELGEAGTKAFEGIANLHKLYLLSPEYFFRQHYIKEFNEEPEWKKSHRCNCDCCGYYD